MKVLKFELHIEKNSHTLKSIQTVNKGDSDNKTLNL